MGRDVSELTERVSALHIGPASRARTPEPAPSTDGQHEQLQRDLADQRAANEDLRAANEDLRLDLETTKTDLADCQETSNNQPPVEDCVARLRDRQARLETKCAQQLVEEKARWMKEVREAAQVFRAEKEAELANVVADAEEEKRSGLLYNSPSPHLWAKKKKSLDKELDFSALKSELSVTALGFPDLALESPSRKQQQKKKLKIPLHSRKRCSSNTAIDTVADKVGPNP
ncbi:hypothetical protein MMC22_004592 [Lobaria immixta]|nr:hypothetical protein [Lobaria immixta]